MCFDSWLSAREIQNRFETDMRHFPPFPCSLSSSPTSQLFSVFDVIVFETEPYVALTGMELTLLIRPASSVWQFLHPECWNFGFVSPCPTFFLVLLFSFGFLFCFVLFVCLFSKKRGRKRKVVELGSGRIWEGLGKGSISWIYHMSKKLTKSMFKYLNLAI